MLRLALLSMCDFFSQDADSFFFGAMLIFPFDHDETLGAQQVLFILNIYIYTRINAR